MKKFVSCFLFWLVSISAAFATKHFHSGFHHVETNRGRSDTVDYLFSRKQATWDAAVKGCKGFRGSRLLSVETKEESELVLSMINNDELFDPPLPIGTTFWTSGAYNIKFSTWEWTSSTNKDQFGNWTQKMWVKDQPTNPIQDTDRVVLERNNLNHSSWRSVSATEKAFYICEF